MNPLSLRKQTAQFLFIFFAASLVGAARSHAGWDFFGGEENDVKAWQKLPPERRALISENFKKFNDMSPEKRKFVRERWQTFQRMPRGRQEAMVTANLKAHGFFQRDRSDHSLHGPPSRFEKHSRPEHSSAGKPDKPDHPGHPH